MGSQEITSVEDSKQQEQYRLLEECYALALRSSADYAIEFDTAASTEFQQHVHAMEDRLSEESAAETLRSVQASFRGELRDYRDKARAYIQRLRGDLDGAEEAMNTFAGSLVSNNAGAEQQVRGELHNLEVAAESNDLQHEIRLLHREMEAERRAAWTDLETGAWVKRKIDDRIEDLLKSGEPSA